MSIAETNRDSFEGIPEETAAQPSRSGRWRNLSRVKQIGSPLLFCAGILTVVSLQGNVSAQEFPMIPEMITTPTAVATVCAQELTPVFDKDGNFLWWPNTCVPEDYKRAPYPTEIILTPETKSVCAQVITYAIDPITGEVKQFPTPCDVPSGYLPYSPLDSEFKIPETKYRIFIPSVLKNDLENLDKGDFPRVGPQPGQPRPVVPLR